MQINVVGRNIEVTPTLKSFTIEKLTALEKRDHQISHVTVTLHIENLTQIAEATLHLHGTDLHATAEADDMYQSIEILATKLLTQLTKHKEKIIESHR